MVHFWGPRRAIFKHLALQRIADVLSDSFSLWGKAGLQETQAKYSQILCFVVFGRLDQIDMKNVKNPSAKPFGAQKVHGFSGAPRPVFTPMCV